MIIIMIMFILHNMMHSTLARVEVEVALSREWTRETLDLIRMRMGIISIGNSIAIDSITTSHVIIKI